MPLDRAIAAGKERRAPYYRGGRFDRTCRPGGSCPYCRDNRAYQERKERERAAMSAADYADGEATND